MMIQLLIVHLVALLLQPLSAATFPEITLLHQAVNGAIYYVAPTGDDAAPGTLEQPWQTIQAALDYPALAPGDTIALLPGRYEEAARVNRSGEAGAPITLRSHDPANPAILTHPNRDVITIIDQSHWVIRDLHLEGWACGGIQVNAQTRDITDITIADNLLENNISWDVCGISLHAIVAATANPNVEISHVTVRNNLLRDVISGKPTAYNENITFIGNVTHSQIIDNQIIDGSYIGIDLIGRLYEQAAEDSRYHDYGQPYDILIKGNVIDGLKPPEGGGTPVGIYLDGALGPVIIEENRVRGASGIYLNTEWTAWQAGSYLTPSRQIIVRRNQLSVDQNGAFALAMGYETWQNGDECFAHAEDNVAVHNTAVVGEAYRTNLFMCAVHTAWKNNIFVHNNDELANFHDIYRPATPGEGLLLDGNLYYSATQQQQYIFPGSEGYGSFSDWQTGTGQDAAGRFAAPNLLDAAQGNFALKEGSAAVDNGVALTAATAAGRASEQLTVADARYFTDGFGLQPGDLIQVGEAGQARVTAVNYATNTLMLDKTLTWPAGADVSYAYAGAGPDIGAVESEFTRAELSWWQRLITQWALRD